MDSEGIELQLPVPGQGLVMDLGVPARPDSSLLEALLQQVLADALLRRYGVVPEDARDGPVIPEDGAGAPSELAGRLAVVDPTALDDGQAIDYLKAAARVEAWVQSCQVQALNRFALLRTARDGDRDPEGFSRFAPQEISAHLSTGE